jgi:Flp pilus assembly protein TadG
MFKWSGRAKAGRDAKQPGLLSRLRRDVRGNTLAIIGAALVPLAGMIGSGVDMSRAYMARTRLQSACDAAALAGRRIMQNDTLNSTVTNEAIRFFNFNFPQRLYNTATFTPVVTKPASGTIRVTASTTIPTSIMKLFGFTTLPLNVTCDASLNFVNTDVMLVLDNTGSMANDVNDNPTTPSNSKLQALRDAVMAMYDTLAPTQTQLQAAGMRLRYGIVPYSSSVNVAALIRGVDPTYLTATTDYQSRVGNFTTAVNVPNTPTTSGATQEIYGSSITQANCTLYGQNAAFSGFSPSSASGGGPAPTATWTRNYSNNSASGVDWGWAGASDTSGTSRSCRRSYTTTTTTYTVRYAFSSWTYQKDTYDTSVLRTGAATTLATDTAGTMPTSGSYNAQEMAALGSGFATTPSSGDGCIEERDTTSTVTSSTNAIPASAFDLDINRIPNNDATRWKVHWPTVVYTRTAGSTSASSGSSMAALDPSFYACPAAAVRLTAWTRTNLLNYVNALAPIGGTYHDIGMIWGARLLSNAGIFADSPDTFNGMPVSRHIIFLTDGQLAPNCNTYTSYGVEQNDMRVTGSASCTNQYNNHLQRFRLICNAAKSLNISIWVIALGTTLSTDLQNCASNPNQASTIADRDALIARFQQIGSQIGALRLTQ